MSDKIADLDARGFVRVETGAEPVWLKCDGCAKSDHFLFDGARIECACGATYDHALTPAGETVGLDGLRFVAWDEGPKQLADMEVDPVKIGLLVVVVVLVIAIAAVVLGG